MTLVIRLDGDPLRIFCDEADVSGQCFRESVVWGPQPTYVITDTSRRGAVAGVQFRPGGAMPLLGLPGGDLTGRHAPLGDIWGAAARQLREHLIEARSPHEIFAILEQQLTAKLRRPLLVHPAVAFALRELSAAPPCARIAQIQTDTGFTPKRFIQLFSESVGLTPKLYSRIQRFQAVLRAAASGERIEWARVAADCGYYDQPHLNRDFRCFSGITPGCYQPVSKDRPHHVPIEEKNIQDRKHARAVD